MSPNTRRVSARYQKHVLDFKFDAGTSRGVLRKKETFIVALWTSEDPGCIGWGEAGPLPKLSMDDVENFEEILSGYLEQLSREAIMWTEKGVLGFCKAFVHDRHPSIRFALETALLDVLNGGERRILANDFYDRHEAIPINGLIWMGEVDFMLRQIEEKLFQGFTCIKMKIGAIDFEQECHLLAHIRKQYAADQVTLRVDANGAFSPSEAMSKLERLARYDLHSIEQPIKAGNWREMAMLCKDSPLDIALDEELIGIVKEEERMALLEAIQPPYIILKPTLVGGIGDTREWIRLAEERGIGWWMTSALESNIGLNAISQLTSSYRVSLPQGLGTGQLYHNNIPSPLVVENGKLIYQTGANWGELNRKE